MNFVYFLFMACVAAAFRATRAAAGNATAPASSHRQPRLAAVVMNYARPEQVRTRVVPMLLLCPGVELVLICHCKQDTAFTQQNITTTTSTTGSNTSVLHRNMWDKDSTWGVGIRFLCATDAALEGFDAVLFLDDDAIFQPALVEQVFSSWKKRRTCVHGIKGTGIGWNETSSTYTYVPKRPKLASPTHSVVVLTQLCVVARDTVRAVLAFVEQCAPVRELLQQGSPKWNGEDILLSMYALHVLNRRRRDEDYCNVLVPYSVDKRRKGKDLFSLAPEEGEHLTGIHRRWPKHFEHRSALVDLLMLELDAHCRKAQVFCQ